MIDRSLEAGGFARAFKQQMRTAREHVDLDQVAAS